MKNEEKVLPDILIISGTHGNETNAVQDVFDLSQSYEYERPVSFLQAWNVPALNEHERCFQKEDDEIPDDLNRAFINAKKKKYDKDLLITKVKDATQYKDVIIDVHNSELLKNCIVINNDEHARAYVDFCKAHEIPYIVIESSTDTIKKFALENDQIGFTVEIGDMNFSDSNDSGVDFLCKLVAALNEEWTKNKLNKLRMKDRLYTSYEVSQNLIVHSEGLLRVIGPNGLDTKEPYGQKPKKSNILKEYKKGEEIFVIANPNDSYKVVQEVITAPCDCILIDLVDTYWVSPGEIIGSVQPIL